MATAKKPPAAKSIASALKDLESALHIVENPPEDRAPALEAALQDLSQEHKMATAELARVEARLAEVEPTADRCAAVERRMAQVAAENLSLQERATLGGTVGALQGEIRTLKATIASLEDRAESASRIPVMEREAAALKSALASLEDRAEEGNAVNGLRREIEALTSGKEDLRARAEAADQIPALQSALETADKTRATMQSRIDEMSGAVQDAADLRAANAELRGEIEALKAQLATTQETARQYGNQLRGK